MEVLKRDDFRNEWDSVYEQIYDIRNFDVKSYIKDRKFEATQIRFFYNNVVPQQTGNPSTSFYKPKISPEAHQLAYFNLTQGFPKELRGGHWCYIVKHVKSKYIIIPCTSVKSNSSPPDPEYQMDIEINGLDIGHKTRLQLSDIRSVDPQRLYLGKGIYDVITERGIIMNSLYDSLYE